MTPSEKKRLEAERRKKIYRVVRNAYGQKELADKAKSWSDDRILRELGLRLPKKMPDLKPLPTPEQLTRKKRELRKYQESVRDIGLKPEQAAPLKGYSRKKIKTSKEYFDAVAQFEATTQGRQRRMDLWASWSKGQLPPEVHRLARQINSQTVVNAYDPVTGKMQNRRLDATDHYGYAVAYYMFIDGMTKEQVMKNFLPSNDLNDSGQFVRSRKRSRRSY